MSRDRSLAIVVGMTIVLLLVVVAIADLQRQGVIAARPSPTVAGLAATPVPAPTPATPVATPSQPPAATPRGPDVTAMELASALGSSDRDRIRALITPGGWVGAWYEGERTFSLTRDETIAFLLERTPDGRIRARVEATPLFPRRDLQPPGDVYVRSTWTAFNGRAQQQVDLVLKPDADGRWYWSGALFQAP